MAKYTKGVTLAIAPYKTITILVAEKESFEECDKELLKELGRMPVIKELNAKEIRKVFPNGKRK